MGLEVGDEKSDVLLVSFVNQAALAKLALALASALGQDVATAFGAALDLSRPRLAKALFSAGFALHLGHEGGDFARGETKSKAFHVNLRLLADGLDLLGPEAVDPLAVESKAGRFLVRSWGLSPQDSAA